MNTNITQSIHTSEPVPGVSLYVVKMGTRFTTIRGSFLGGSNFSPSENPAVALVTAAMLDRGTKHRSKRDLHDALLRLGASVSFTCSGERIRFDACCLKRHVPKVIALIGDMLRYPRFGNTELSTVKKQLSSALLQRSEDTRYLAESACLEMLYPKQHPYYRIPLQRMRKYVEAITRRDLSTYHKSVFGRGSLIIVAAGAVAESEVSKALERAFDGWRMVPALSRVRYARQSRALSKPVVSRSIRVPDKASVDIVLGAALPISKEHPDYVPFLIALAILGEWGTFTNRLMREIREKRGLTYGIYAAPGGFEGGLPGYWLLWGTFAPRLLQTGRTVTLHEFERFRKKGVSRKEVVVKKVRMAGFYTVLLANTRGISERILMNAEDGRPVSYLDLYRDALAAVSAAQVNRVIRQYFARQKLVLAEAGSV